MRDNDPAEIPNLASLPIFDDAPAPLAGPARPRPRVRTEADVATPPHGIPTAPAKPPTAPGRGDASTERVFWRNVTAMRETVAARLAEALADRQGADDVDRREIGRMQIEQAVRDHQEALISGGSPRWPGEYERRMKGALYDAIFGLGRLQPLVDNPRVENIHIVGHDTVILKMIDGSEELAAPVADSDEDLINYIAFLATRNAEDERSFTRASPSLDLSLPGKVRLRASAWTTPRPVVVLRCSRHQDIDLDRLRQFGEMTRELQAFLTAAVRARRSIVVSGSGQGSGKTTLLRALARATNPREFIGTVETEYELYLDELLERRGRISAWQARPGSGERGLNGRAAGEVTVDDLLHGALRADLDRVIVGEVRGREVVQMFKAMQTGNGSLSTIHAHSARDVIDRLVTCAVEDASLSESFAYRLVAQLDLIVFISVDIDPETGRRHRYISDVIEVTLGEGPGGLAVTEIFARGPEGHAVPVGTPSFLDQLERQGFDRHLLQAHRWGQPEADR